MIVVGQDGYFDDKTILAMALAYDRACGLLRSFGNASTVQEIVAKRIVEVAAQGERDPDRLRDQALEALGIEETPKPSAA
jgi:hypothetical protein